MRTTYVFVLVGALVFVASTARADEPRTEPRDVQVTSNRDGTTLEKLDTAVHFGWFRAEGYQVVCVAPCLAHLDPSATYKISGDGVVPSKHFQLQPGESALNADTGSSGARRWGWTSAATGSSFMVAGGVMLALGFAFAPNASDSKFAGPSGRSLYESQDRMSGIYTGIGGGMLAFGGVLTVLGVVLVATNGTTITTSSGREIGSASTTRSGLRFGPEGIVF